MECDACETRQKTVFPCDSCRKSYCKACAGLTSSEVKVLELKDGRVMRFYCSDCDSRLLLQKTIDDKISIIEGKDEIIDLLKQKIQILERNSSLEEGKRLYSQAVLQTPQSSDKTGRFSGGLPSVIIKPRSKQSAEVTKSDLQQNIKPAELKIAIRSTRNIRNGGIVVKCQTKEDMELLKTEAANKLIDYTVDAVRMKRPRFKIAGYSGDLDLKQIQQCIREQNKFVAEEDDFNITYLRKNRKTNTSTLYGECSPDVFHKLLNRGRVFVQWQRCPVYEDLSIQRCYRCQEHYHKSGTCQKTVVCEYCAGEHKITDCPRDLRRCNNCQVANVRYNLKYDTQHSAGDSDCPSYRYLLSVLRSRIDYGIHGS